MVTTRNEHARVMTDCTHLWSGADTEDALEADPFLADVTCMVSGIQIPLHTTPQKRYAQTCLQLATAATARSP